MSPRIQKDPGGGHSKRHIRALPAAPHLSLSGTFPVAPFKVQGSGFTAERVHRAQGSQRNLSKEEEEEDRGGRGATPGKGFDHTTCFLSGKPG